MTFIMVEHIKVEYCFEGKNDISTYLSYSIFTEIMQCVVFFDKIILNTNNQMHATNIYTDDSNTFAPRFETRTEVYTNHVRK